MLQIERQEQILQLLSGNGALRVGDLAKALYTSEATVRRDLSAMEKQGLVRRVYGGVVPAKEDMPLDFRSKENTAAKREIAAKAARLIREGDTVFLDASSTAQHLIPHLSHFRELTVITNSLRVLEALSAGPHRLLSTGGEVISRNMALVGRAAESTLENLAPSIAFFSAQGLSECGEITDSSEEETALRRAVLRRAVRRVFLCDSSKLGKQYLYRLCHLRDVDDVIADRALPPDILSQ